MIDFVLYLIVLAVSLAGVAINVFSLPGNWIMFAAAAGLCAATGGKHPSVPILLLMLLILIAAEVLEFFGGMYGARRGGASKAASWAAIGGAIVGGIVGTPVPIIGNIV